MNRRTLKKHCKRAMCVLIKEHRYENTDFKAANGDESIYAPCRMERQFVEHGFIRPGPLKGTPLLWKRTSYEYDEWDCDLPYEVLDEIEFWENASEQDISDLAGRSVDELRRAL